MVDVDSIVSFEELSEDFNGLLFGVTEVSEDSLNGGSFGGRGCDDLVVELFECVTMFGTTSILNDSPHKDLEGEFVTSVIG